MLSVASAPKRKEQEDAEDREPAAVSRLKREIDNMAPSSLNDPGRFKQISGPMHTINCNRPFESDSIPIALLDENFGHFLKRKSEPPSLKAVLLLHKLDRELRHHAINSPHDDEHGMGRLFDVRSRHVRGCWIHLAVHARDKGLQSGIRIYLLGWR